MVKRALIYGISGQDGYYLSKLLSEKGYEVAGASRKGGRAPYAHKCYAADLAGKAQDFLFPIDDFSPDEVYNLAGISNPQKAESDKEITDRVNWKAPERILEKISMDGKGVRFFQASSCFMFSGSQRINEKTQPSPTSAYGRAKLGAHLAVGKHRGEGLYACSGILFNHESPLRPREFVTRKITYAVAEFKLGMRKEPLMLGSLDAVRDWGFAGDYVEAMWLMLQQKEPDDYVIATGESHTVRDFCREAFSHAGLDYRKLVQVSNSLVRASDINISADITRIIKIGWKPKTGFGQLVHMMVDADIQKMGKGD